MNRFEKAYLLIFILSANDATFETVAGVMAGIVAFLAMLLFVFGDAMNEEKK